MDDLDKALAGLIGTPVVVAKGGAKAPSTVPQHDEPTEIWFLQAETLLVERVTCSCGRTWEIPHGVYHHYKTFETVPRLRQQRWMGAPLGEAAGPDVRRDVKVLVRQSLTCGGCWSAYSTERASQYALPFNGASAPTVPQHSPQHSTTSTKPLVVKPIKPEQSLANLADLKP